MNGTKTRVAVLLAAVVLAFGLTGCEQVMQAPVGREQAHQRCVQAKGTWEETPSNWRCNK